MLGSHGERRPRSFITSVISPRWVAWDSGLTARYRSDPAVGGTLASVEPPGYWDTFTSPDSRLRTVEEAAA
jgi:hypothetical protein